MDFILRLQLVLTGTELVRSHVHTALCLGLWAATEWFTCAVSHNVCGHVLITTYRCFFFSGHFT
jgi:hypothetical protein